MSTPASTPTHACPRCGTHLATAPSPGGLCPRCLLQLGFESDARSPEVVVTGAAEPLEPPPTPEELAPRFPELEIVEQIGRGGMGTVYKARQKGLDRLVALKILPHEAARDPSWPERFAREARALARLSHPNIVAVFDSGERDGLYYLAMEFVDGTSLRDVIQARSSDPRQALRIVTKVCDALQYAHEEGVVHRDIKPENILVDTRGRVKIADFGLAKLVKGDKADLTLTGPQQTMGTPQYMAPEQIESPSAVDHRADIFSLGVVFYELLTGELPLGRFAVPSQKIHVDVRLDEVVLKTLAKEPALRYQHASQVKTDVEGISARVEAEARDDEADRQPSGFFERQTRRARRARRRITGALDPRSASNKRVGDVEVPASWPISVALFLVALVVAAITGSAALLFLVVAAALGGLVWLIRKTV